MTTRRPIPFGLAALAGCTLAACSVSPASETASSDRAGSTERVDAASQTGPGRALALTCSGCHGASGDSVPSLEGLSRSALQTRLMDYRTDTSGTTVMHRLMRGYDEAQIASVSRYLSSNEAAQSQ